MCNRVIKAKAALGEKKKKKKKNRVIPINQDNPRIGGWSSGGGAIFPSHHDL